MTDKQFYTLWTEAQTSTDREAFISDWALSSVWEDAEDAPIPDGRADAIGAVWDTAHLTIRDIRASTGLSQVAFAQRFCIPRRTVEDWEAGRRSCPDYVRLLLARAVKK